MIRERIRQSPGRVRAVLVVVLCAPIVAGCSPGPPASPSWFEESGEQLGLDFIHRSGQAAPKLFPEIMGGGAALFDMDGDGDLDAYLVQSGSLRAPEDEPDGNRLFANDGHGRFTDVTAGSGAGDRGYGMGVAAGDYDDDGDVDLYVTNLGPDVLLRNEGQGRFTDVTSEAGIAGSRWGTSAAFVDHDADGDLDLFVVNYVDWSIGMERDCYTASGITDYCLPTDYGIPSMDRLYRNEGNGRFTDISVEAGLQTAFGNGLGVVCTDADGDGRVDIFVANDAMMNQLWLNIGPDRFADEALLRGCALDEHGMAKSGMGVAAPDIDDDGDEDLLVVNMQRQTDSFFVNENGLFRDRTGEIGLATVSRAFTRFGVGFVDFDNDGRLDLFEANGRVVLTLEPETEDPYAEANLLFRGTDTGRFEEVLPRGGTSRRLVATSRAAAFGDVDGDGGVDILVVNRDARAHLLRNIVPDRGHWIRLKVLERSGRDALGATVTAEFDGRRVVRVVRSAYSYLASSDPAVHLGLGQAAGVRRVTVRWADGETQEFRPLAADRTVELRRGN